MVQACSGSIAPRRSKQRENACSCCLSVFLVRIPLFFVSPIRIDSTNCVLGTISDAWIPLKSNRLKAAITIFSHSAWLSLLVAFELMALMLAPNSQGRVFLVLCWNTAVPMGQNKGFQRLKMFLPTSCMRSPNESHMWQPLFSLITQSRVLSFLFQLVLVALTI